MQIWNYDVWMESGMGGHYTQISGSKTTEEKAIQAVEEFLRSDKSRLKEYFFKNCDWRYENWKRDYGTYVGPYHISVWCQVID